MKISDNFKQAAKDYLWLLNKGYPQKKVLSLVGDRYRLLKTERSILYRGISAGEEAAYRSSKRHQIDEYSNKELHVDTLNVLLTIAAYLHGKPVFICNDGWLRDAQELHSGKTHVSIISLAINLLTGYLQKQRELKAFLYIDSKADSGQEVRQLLHQNDIKNIAVFNPVSADHVLKDLKGGILATSDSQLINKTPCPVIDLAKNILEQNYSPVFPDMRKL